MSHVGSSGHQVTSILREVPGQSWDVHHGIVRTSIYFTLEECPRTVLGCPSWDCPDIKLLHLGRMSQDSPGMSLMGLSGHQVTSAWKDVPGHSWDVPHRILRTSCHPSLQGCPRTVLGCLKSRIVLRCPGHL